jgi:hypothetical protein
MTPTPTPPAPLPAGPAAMAAHRLLTKHGGCIEDAAAEARQLQLRYSPGTSSWDHYARVQALILR